MATCFVSLPATPVFDSYYRDKLVRAIQRLGLDPVRADDLDRRGAIWDQIRSGVAEAAICVVDITGRNSAALYVLGIAHGMNKPVVLLLQSPDDAPLDLRFGRNILYRPGTARWEDMLALQVESAIRDMLEVSRGTAP